MLAAARVTPDEPALNAAVRQAALACPGACLVQDGRDWVASGRPVPVRAVSTDQDGPQALCRLPELREPLPEGESCEVLLVGGAVNAVVFRVSHAVMDGRGMIHFAGDVFRALRGEPLLGALDVTTGDEVLAGLGAAPAPTAPVPGLPGLLGPRAPLTEPHFIWRRVSLECHRPGLVARVAAAVAGWPGADSADATDNTANTDSTGAAGGTVFRFTIPVDLRRHAPKTRSTANMVQAVTLEVAAGEDWQDVQGQLLRLLMSGREVASRIDPGIVAIPLPMLRQMYQDADAKEAKAGVSSVTASLSHLGRVDVAEFSAPGFQASAVYPLAGRPMCSAPELAMLESQDRTEIVMSWYDAGPRASRLMGEILDTVVGALAAAGASGH